MRGKRVLSVILAFLLAFTTLFSGGFLFTGDIREVLAARPSGRLPETADLVQTAINNGAQIATGANTWTIAVYVCATDLESEGAAATSDMLEMIDADIPDNVNLILLTGGTERWKDAEMLRLSKLTDAEKEEEGFSNYYNDYHNLDHDVDVYLGDMKNDDPKNPTHDRLHDFETQIWQIRNDSMTELYCGGANNICDMSSPQTVKDFLKFAQQLAPAEHFMVSFWDHGGGPLVGAEAAQYLEDGETKTAPYLTVSEIEGALHGALTEGSGWVPAGSGEQKGKYDIVGFDCCLMGTAETAYEFRGVADYFVGSEEIEPGGGWNYRWLNVFNSGFPSSNDNGAQSIAIGTRIIELFSNGIDKTSGNKDDVSASKVIWESTDFVGSTLALIETNKMEQVKTSFDKLGAALLAIYGDMDYMEEYIDLYRAIYELPSMMDGYFGLVDSYMLAKSIYEMDEELLKDKPNDEKLLAIKDAASDVMKYTGCGSFDFSQYISDKYSKTPRKGEVGELEGNDGAIKYRALSSEYSGGNGLGIYYPIQDSVNDVLLERTVSKKTSEDGFYFTGLDFNNNLNAQGEKNGLTYYARLINKIVKDRYNPSTFKFNGSIKAEEITDTDENGKTFKAINVTAENDDFRKIAAVDANYIFHDEANNKDILLCIVPTQYDKEKAHYQIVPDNIKAAYKMADGMEDFFTYYDYSNYILVPAYVALTDEEKEFGNSLERDQTIDETKVRFLQLAHGKDKGDIVLIGIWETVYDEEGTPSSGRISLDTMSLGNEFAYYPLYLERDNKTGETSYRVNKSAKDEENVVKVTDPENIKLPIKAMALPEVPGYKRAYSFTAYDVYSNPTLTEKPLYITTQDSDKTSETSKVNNPDGSTTEKEKITFANGTVLEKTTVTKPNGDYKSKTVQKNAAGKVTKTVTETKTTSKKSGDITFDQKTVKANGAAEETKVVVNSKGKIKTATVTNTTSTGKKTKVEIKTDKSGKLVVKNIDSALSTVTIPDAVKDAKGKSHKIKNLAAKVLNGEKKVKTLNVGKNIEKFEKNALKGSNVKTITLKTAPKFEKNSLKNGNKLTIKVPSKTVQKKVKKQLKKAGAPKAKVKVVK